MKNKQNATKPSIPNLIKFILSSMLYFEDATQMADDSEISNYLNSEVLMLDEYYHKIIRTKSVTKQDINSIRLIVKYSYKMVPEKIAEELALKYKNILFN